MISGSTLDDFVHINTFAFEPLRREDKAINNFLFTMPLQSEIVTQFNPSVTGSFTLYRKYDTETLEKIVKNALEIEQTISQENVLDYIITIEEEPISQTERDKDYVRAQPTNMANFITDPLEKIHLLKENFVGFTIKEKQQTIVKTDVEKVIALDEKQIELNLKFGIEKIDLTKGCLTEVFVSGSDGKLQRLFKDDLVDLYGKVAEEGFSRYITLEIDKK